MVDQRSLNDSSQLLPKWSGGKATAIPVELDRQTLYMLVIDWENPLVFARNKRLQLPMNGTLQTVTMVTMTLMKHYNLEMNNKMTYGL